MLLFPDQAARNVNRRPDELRRAKAAPGAEQPVHTAIHKVIKPSVDKRFCCAVLSLTGRAL
jgi:hypothetical protein